MRIPRDRRQITEIGCTAVVRICLAVILAFSAASKAATAAPLCQETCLQQRSSCYAAINWRAGRERVDQQKSTCIAESTQCLVGCLR